MRGYLGVLLAVVGGGELGRVGDLILKFRYGGEDMIDGSLALAGDIGDGFNDGNLLQQGYNSRKIDTIVSQTLGSPVSPK